MVLLSRYRIIFTFFSLPIPHYLALSFTLFAFLYLFLCALCVCVQSLSCARLFCNPMDYSLPSSSVKGIFQAGIFEWIAMPSSRGSSLSRDQTYISCFLHWQMSSLPLSHLGSPCLSLLDFKKKKTRTLFINVYFDKVSKTSKKYSTSAYHHQSKKEGDTFCFIYSLSYIILSHFLCRRSKLLPLSAVQNTG